MAFKLPELPYAHDALEPYIDAQTMEIHHGKHHAGYTNNLNNAIAGSDLEGKSIEDILKNISSVSTGIRNNAGGFYNHDLFWNIMGTKHGGEPTADLKDAIVRDFGSLEGFKEKFSTAAATRFGSGWAWLCVQQGGKLDICSTANQDNPLMDIEGTCGGMPVIGLDVWEHAYYLKYQNRRADYISAFFNVINWNVAADRYNQFK